MLHALSGWPAVAGLGAVLLVLAIVSCVAVMRGLPSTLSVAALSFPAMWLLANYVCGDASRLLPPGFFSDGFDGKDQIVIVSLLATVLGGITIAAWLVAAIKSLDRVLMTRMKA